ncbi:MAG: SDR family NAD(P)-dependent oxidoreductase [Candidatus Binataceae bacterium]
MKLANKVAVITGAGSGMGKAAALLFAAEGAAVTTVDINLAAASETAGEIKASGGRAIAIGANVSKSAEVKGMFEQAVSQFGHLDIVYNNAGVIEDHDLLHEIGDDEFERVLQVNLQGVFFGIKYAIPHLIKAGGGAIINTASVGGLKAFTGKPAYTASKAAVIALTQVAGMQYGRHNIRINCICPGIIYTGMSREVHRQKFGKELDPGIKGRISALGRIGMPEDIARVALFLASDDAAFVTAAPFVVDGGYTTG